MQPRMILVAGETKGMQKAYAMMLRQYQVAFADDGRQALERLRSFPEVDLVLTKVNMPFLDGVELMAKLREERGAEAPVVVIVGYEGQEAEIQRALEAGAAAYIKSPFRSEELNEVIDRLDSPWED